MRRSVQVVLGIGYWVQWVQGMRRSVQVVLGIGYWVQWVQGMRRSVQVVLGIGYWVQGMRSLAWMGVNFFLKDSLQMDPSTLQLLLNSANLPMLFKPLYGLLSDSFSISGQRRLPYLSLAAFLQAVSWLAIAILARSGVSITTITIYLLLSNLGASIAEVTNDAIVAEASKQQPPPPPSSKPHQRSSSSGELQSFVWMASSLGGVFGNLLGGLTIHRVSPEKMFLLFGLIASLQFFLTISIHESSLNLPMSSSSSSSNVGFRKQLSKLKVALQDPAITRSLTWFAASYAVIPTLAGTMFFYQTEHLKIDSWVLGMSKVVGQAAMLAWGIVYDRWMKRMAPRKVIAGVQVMMAVLMVSDVLFVKGVYRSVGVADLLYVVLVSGVLETMFFAKILPFTVVMTRVCPEGCEGSLMALMGSAIALALILSGYLGVALAGFVGDDFSGFPKALLIQAACTLLPLYWSSCIPDPDDGTEQISSKQE